MPKNFINFSISNFSSAHVIILHDAEVIISIELDAEVNVRCRSPQVAAEVTRAEHRFPFFGVSLHAIVLQQH